MGIFDALKKNLFSVSFESKLMKTIKTPVFIKDFNTESQEIIRLKELLDSTADEALKKKIQNELYLQNYVHDGLSKVYFELKNSPVPFYGIHNITLGTGSSTENIDFLLVTSQFCCIVKCKSLQGNIEIDSQGNFSRWVKKGEKWSKEGIYSPVEQNRRSELAVKALLNNINADKMPVLSLTVFTNPKAVLNFKECPEEIIDKVVKVDLLNTKRKDLVESTPAAVYDEIKALEAAQTFIRSDVGTKVDHSFKFESAKTMDNNSEVKKETVSPSKAASEDDKERIINALKAYRTVKATAEKVPPYYVFNNEEMERIIAASLGIRQSFFQ